MAIHAICGKPRNVDFDLSYLMMSLLKPPFDHPMRRLLTLYAIEL
ncbi:MAG: hypothetical protein ACE5IO_09855 [Thermoplasmata archaeon]